ncbi:hypothetical protein [Kiloniella sp.]|uniref:hypothetical protein n=1 Tax=Kiloniella sp. TaxID=1938587 RepID=UPI003A94BF39
MSIKINITASMAIFLAGCQATVGNYDYLERNLIPKAGQNVDMDRQVAAAECKAKARKYGKSIIFGNIGGSATNTVFLNCLEDRGWVLPNSTQDGEYRLGNWTREEIGRCTKIVDDHLSVVVEFDSSNCDPDEGLEGKVFLRAHKGKKDSEVLISYQVYTITKSDKWLFPVGANFYSDEIQYVSGDRIGSDVDCSVYSCSHTEHFVFNLTRENFKALDQYHTKNPQVKFWEYRINTQSGVKVDRKIRYSELLGFFDVVEGYQSSEDNNIKKP